MTNQLKAIKLSNQLKAIELYFPAMLFIQGGSNFESVDEILKCDHSNESY